MRPPIFLFRSSLVLLWLGASFSAGAQRIHPAIESFLRKEKTQWQLTDDDISHWTISDQYENAETGVTYTYLHQQVEGIRIFNAVSTMALRNEKVVHFANRFYPEAAKKANATTPSLLAEQAIGAAASHLGLTLRESPQFLEQEPNRLRYIYSQAGISKENIKAELVLVPEAEALRLAWNVNIAPNGTSDWWNVRIDALNGQVIEKNNWTTYCDFDAEHAHADECTYEYPQNVLRTENNSSWQANETYNVFPLPIEAPNFGNRGLVTNPNSPVASPFGWHDTDGFDGPEYTITRGNNVHAYEDSLDLNDPGYSPDGGPFLQFNAPLDLKQSTLYNLDASLTNLFYTSNMIHDILYLHGFDEGAGNFQETNFSGHGIGDDHVRAEGIDGSGTNNANFNTPDDGKNGRMQMYLWDLEVDAWMKILAPGSVAGYYDAAAAVFGPSLETPLTGYVVVVNDDVDPASNGCDSILNQAELAGKIAMIDRGGCVYLEKVNAAEAAGAIGVIMVNTNPTAPINMTGNGTSNIPAVMITQADGAMIKALLQAGDSVQVTIALGPYGIDCSLDNGVIAHEYGHGLSNRLTGGPSNSDCLDNREQGGEGWSDWLGLILTIEPGDSGTDPRGMGTYSSNDASGNGIRRFPYSTDMAINSQNYGDLVNSFGAHARGEIWNSALWDMTWMLIGAEGFDPDWYNGNAGNHTAMRLVIEGMKLQPCGPGYVEGRDAILAADELLYFGAHRCLIWEAFANRGLGAYADQGSADDPADGTADFSMPNTCLTATVPPTARFSVSDTINCFGYFSFKDLSTDIPQYYYWDFGDGHSSDLVDPVHTYSAPGEYTVLLIVENNVGADTFEMKVAYTDPVPPVVSGNKTVCEGSYTTLTSDAAEGKTAIWSVGDSVVHTGITFRTPVLMDPVTYSVVQSDYRPEQHVGPVDTLFGKGGFPEDGYEGRLSFEAHLPFRLLSVLAFARGAGDRIIRLYDEHNQEIASDTVSMVNGRNRVMLNLDIPAPGIYSLANASENLYRSSEGADYPYDIEHLVSITGSNAIEHNETYYYYFYDWVVQAVTCKSPPVEVNVDVTPGTLAGFLADAVDLTATFTDISSGAPVSWSWDFGDGSSASSEQHPVHTYPAEDIYETELTVTDGTCFSSFRDSLEVGFISGSKELEDAFGLTMYPNPAADEVYIEIHQALAGKIHLRATDATGHLMLSRSLEANEGRYTINTSAFTPGTYQFQLIGDAGVSIRRVVIVQ